MENVSTRAGVLAGGALLIIGSFMTWISVDVGFSTFSATGTADIEGKLTAAAGIVVLLVGAVLLTNTALHGMARYLGLAAAMFGAVVLLLEYLQVQERIAETDPAVATATVGLGVWVTGIGALVALGALGRSLIGARQPSN